MAIGARGVLLYDSPWIAATPAVIDYRRKRSYSHDFLLTPSDVTVCELFGGGLRVPSVRSCVVDAKPFVTTAGQL